MKAMVLAAGQGTRLRPITDNLPKALVPVAGRPMIEYPLLLLRHYGIREIIINLHQFGEQIEKYLGDGRKLGVEITYSDEPELLDTGGGLLKAKPFLRDGAFIVINTDALIDLNLAEAIAFHKKMSAAATLVLRPDENADQYGSMDVDDRGKICRFLQSKAPIGPSGPIRKLMFTGVQILEPKVFDYMNASEARQKFSTTKETYPKMLLAGEALYGFCFEGFWQDLGTSERIKNAEESLGLGRVKLHYAISSESET
ncbi:MAG TPA: nucleotidyltransferase family protein [Candidatus Binatia bacterium]|jgi:NDP-sugar pyrophosphorylase family protein|nr:nucleotidyltransferase family protein [Candidatus Binatia bacterium]